MFWQIAVDSRSEICFACPHGSQLPRGEKSMSTLRIDENVEVCTVAGRTLHADIFHPEMCAADECAAGVRHEDRPLNKAVRVIQHKSIVKPRCRVDV